MGSEGAAFSSEEHPDANTRVRRQQFTCMMILASHLGNGVAGGAWSLRRHVPFFLALQGLTPLSIRTFAANPFTMTSSHG